LVVRLALVAVELGPDDLAAVGGLNTPFVCDVLDEFQTASTGPLRVRVRLHGRDRGIVVFNLETQRHIRLWVPRSHRAAVIGVAERVRHKFARAQHNRLTDRVIRVWYEASDLAARSQRGIGLVTEREIDVRWTVRLASCHDDQLPGSPPFQSARRRGAAMRFVIGAHHWSLL
jgi:hypothetical protein